MLNYIFNPKSIALVGASRDADSLGHDILENVKKLGFKGKIYPVNLKAKQIMGLKCYKSVLEIRGKVDLAVIMVPGKFVKLVLEECGKKKIKGVVIISAGFKETGKEGLKEEQELQKIAKKHKIKIIGPNCLGILNPHIKMNASFAEGMPNAGSVGLVSQSGAMAVAIMDWAYQSKIGFSKIISIGNKAGLTELELMEYLAADKDTKVIMMYLESIADGQELMKLADRVTDTKPVIVLKAGASEIGEKAISSHTGSLAGSDQAVETAFAQSGIIRARTVEDFFDYAKAFSWAPLPRDNRVAIVTNAGGPGIMTVDALADTKLQLAKFDAHTNKYLKNNLPASASIKNPVDIIGDALVDRYKVALKAVLDDKNVDAVLCLLTPQTMTQEDETAELIAYLAKHSRKPILPVFMGGEDVNSGRLILQKHKIPNFEYGWRAVRTLEQMYLAKRIKTEVVLPSYKGKNRRLKVEGSWSQLKTRECEDLLSDYGIRVLKSKLYKNKKELTEIKKWPVAMKIASRDVIHKKASGAVEIMIKDHKQAKKVYKNIIENVKKIKRKVEIDGVLVQPMAPPDFTEVIIGMKRDPQFGPMIMFGLGGSFVEILKDVSFRITPVNKKDALKQLQEIKSFELIKDKDLDFLADTLVKLSKFSLDYPQIQEIDLNPVMVYKTGGRVVDTRMMY